MELLETNIQGWLQYLEERMREEEPPILNKDELPSTERPLQGAQLVDKVIYEEFVECNWP